MARIQLHHGFTLVELLVVVAIIAVLIAIAVPIYSVSKEKAEQSVLQHNTQVVKELVVTYSVYYSRDEWYGDYGDDLDDDCEAGDGTLNNYIERILETQVSGHYSNKINLVNPFSKNTSILDCDHTFGSGDGYRPAVFLTANSDYSYTGPGSTNNIIGTIVVYFEVSGGVTERIDLFYINKDGSKSEFIRTIS